MKDIEKLMSLFPTKNGKEKYATFEEIIEDYYIEADDPTLNGGLQSINYLTICHEDKTILKEITGMAEVLDKELYIYNPSNNSITETNFEDARDLKEDEVYFIDIYQLKKPVIDFVRYDLCSFARNNNISFSAIQENIDTGSTLQFEISENGDLKMKAEFSYFEDELYNQVYRIEMLKDIYGTIENMNECLA